MQQLDGSGNFKFKDRAPLGASGHREYGPRAVPARSAFGGGWAWNVSNVSLLAEPLRAGTARGPHSEPAAALTHDEKMRPRRLTAATAG